MASAPQASVDLDVLRAILAGAESMAAYYGKGEDKDLQNAALKAAGLPPLHSERELEWDRQQAAQKRREVECLKAVIAHFDGEARAEAA